MSKREHGRSWRVRVALIAGVALGLGACNDVGNCPDPSVIAPGASCSGDSLSCPYVLQSLDPACNGMMADGGIQTSCVCTHGSWSCPQPVSCPATGDDSGDDGAGSTGDDGAGSTGDDGGGGSDEAGDDGPGE
jgi:hypothetical protein